MMLKITLKNILSLLLVATLLLSCRSLKNNSSENQIESSSTNNSTALPLHKNSQEFFWSPDEKKIFFSVDQTQAHFLHQIYSYDLATKTIQRWTYDDGSSRHPFALSSTELLYSSTTEEKKEDIEALLQGRQDFNSAEIYKRNLALDEIQRITQRRGADVHPQLGPRNEIHFLQQINSNWSLAQSQKVVRSFAKYPQNLRYSSVWNSWAWLEDGQIATLGKHPILAALKTVQKKELQGFQILDNHFYFIEKVSPHQIWRWQWDSQNQTFTCKSLVVELNPLARIEEFQVSPMENWLLFKSRIQPFENTERIEVQLWPFPSVSCSQ